MTAIALIGADLILPDRMLSDHALLVADGRIADIVPRADVTSDCTTVNLDGGFLLPGFIDTQVNGGGDVLFNDSPDIEGITAIAHAHRRFGTTGLLPTLISDDAPVLSKAMRAVEQAMAEGVPGILGIHIEGPHLNATKGGIHDAAKFTRIDDAIISTLIDGSSGIKLITLAPELAPSEAIARLVEGGFIVVAGHSMADYKQTRLALDQGLRGFTHLFNAMTQLGNREPGMVGAALEDRRSWFGLIVDGRHVHPATMRIALAARGTDGVMLVTDAMPPVGGAHAEFTLMGQLIRVVDGVCQGQDGTLAGSALSMAQAFRNAFDWFGLSLVQASHLASGNAAKFLKLDGETGSIVRGLRADLVHLDDRHRVRRTWIAGAMSEEGE
jgi:N-acetylglucosamine-6-phosphate deacetylase